MMETRLLLELLNLSFPAISISRCPFTGLLFILNLHHRYRILCYLLSFTKNIKVCDCHALFSAAVNSNFDCEWKRLLIYLLSRFLLESFNVMAKLRYIQNEDHVDARCLIRVHLLT